MPDSFQSVRIDSSAVVFNKSDCSCDNCDSFTCFTRRRQSHDNCSCFDCDRSKTCIYFPSNAKSNSDFILEHKSNECSLFTKCNKIPPGDLNKTRHDVIKQKIEPIKKTISDKSCGKEVTSGRVDQMASPIKIDGMNDTSSGGNESDTSSVAFRKIDDINDTSGEGNNTDKSSIVHLKIDNINDISGGDNQTDNISVADTASSVKLSRITVQDDDESPTGKLSALIMNVPYDDYKKSLQKVTSGPKIMNWTTEDILNKIKEAYKACSCKVCECITMSSFLQPANDPTVCNCKPCECADCRQMRGKDHTLCDRSSKSCLCNLCIRKAFNEMGRMDLNEKCNCKPCECVQCKANATKICNCKPCECAECTLSNTMHIKRRIVARDVKQSNKQTIIVAPVGEDNRGVCTCTPCNCMACGRTYGTMPTSLTHEMSTGMARPRNCPCDSCLNDACSQDAAEMCHCNGRDKIMRKPVQKDSNDYDIRSALVDYKFNINNDNHRAIAMYTPLASDYCLMDQYNNKNNKGDCKCNICECVVCKQRFVSASIDISEQSEFVQSVQKSKPVPIALKQSCKCSPCECQICLTKDHLHGRACKCKVCECLKCSYAVPRHRSCAVYSRITEICKCEPCKCIDCHNQGLSCVGYKQSFNCGDCECVRCKYKNNVRKDTLNEMQRRQIMDAAIAGTSQSRKHANHISKYCENENFVSKPYDYDRISYYNNSNAVRKHEIVKHCPTHKTSTGELFYVDQNNRIISKNNLNEKPTTTQGGDYLSSEGMSRLPSANKDSSRADNMEPKKHLSGKSSLNSSGHDHSGYLIKFPRSAVETCINDVLKFDLDKNLNFTRLDVPSVGNSDNDYSRSPQYSIYCNKIKPAANGYQDSFRKEKIIANPMPCKDGNLAESCACNPCVCDKCSFSKLKVKRCHCDCVACDCVGSCISEDKSFYIRKNEGTQTKNKVLEDRGQDGSSTKISPSGIFERDFTRMNTQLYPLVAKQMETKRSEAKCTIEPKKLQSYMKFIENPQNCTSNINVYNMPIQINYNSVQSTIREAREFSVQLLHILEKYETANKEFESISQKLKSQGLEFNNPTATVRDVTSLETIVETEKSKSINKELVKTQLKTELSSVDTKQEPTKCYQEIKLDNYNNKEMEVFENFNDIPTKDIPETFLNNKASECKELENITENEETGIESLSSYIFNEVCKKIGFDAQKLEFRDRYKKYRKLIKRAVYISKRFQSNSKNELIPNKCAEVDGNQVRAKDYLGITEKKSIANELSLKDTKTSINIEIKRDDGTTRIFENNTEVKDKSNRLDVESTLKNEFTENNVEVEMQKSLDVMQGEDTSVNVDYDNEAKTEQSDHRISSTIDVKSPDENNNSSYVSEAYSLQSESEKDKLSPLETHVKNAIHSISRQMSGDNNLLKPYLGNQALEKLQTEVHKLLNMPQLQIQGTTYYFTEPVPNTDEKYHEDKKQSSTGFEQKIVDEVAHCSYKTPAFSYKNDRTQQPKPFASIPNFSYPAPSAEPDSLRSYFYGSLGTNTCSLPRTNYEALKVSFYGIRRVSDHTILVKWNPPKEMKDVSGYELPRTNYEALKVSFYGIRRVSDHTILVKWNPPKEMKDVSGYELLVDGHTVQKIPSPTRCMAVVTCLPHSDRIFLTVRTLTTHAPSAQGRSATFVYHPRLK